MLQKIFRVIITTQTEEEYEARLQAQRAKQQRDMRLGPAKTSDGKAVKPATVRRKSRKIKPNEPCPCGSGKKYKRCCRANDELHS